jgi:endonuclease/exonuclease/phosphatase family metal-dependent hydrolase
MRAQTYILALALLCIRSTPVVAAEEFELMGRPRIQAPVRAVWSTRGLQAPESHLRICTYNIENFTDGLHGDTRPVAGAKRQARRAAGILQEIQPGIVVIQEIENFKALKMLNQYLDPPFPIGYVTRFAEDRKEKEKLNIAVLSRYPLQGVREIDFSPLEGDGRPPRGALSFYVELGRRHKLLVYAVHLKSNWGERDRNRAKRRHAMTLLRADAESVLKRYPDFRWEVMITGDMNVDPDAPAFEDDPTLSPFSDWIDLWHGQPAESRVTLPTRHGDPMREFPPVAFDRFVVSQELSRPPWVAALPRALPKGVDTRDVRAEPGRSLFHVSDHYPVYLDLLELSE